MRLKVVLTCVLYQICVNVRVLGMRVQNKRLYAFQACIFDENSHTYFAQQNEATEAALLYAFKQSGFTLPRQTRLDKVSVHFLSIYSIKKASVRFLGILDQN